jgi:hypothetical protein
MKKSANSFLYLFIFILLFPVLLFSQTTNKTIVITTYYPSPSHAFKNLEITEGLAIGDDSETEITNLEPGEIYIGHSIILGNTTPADASKLEGEIIYNPDFNKLQFYNGSVWINASAG